MMPDRLVEWLATTSGSVALHESQYLYVALESVHVLTLCLFVGLSAMLDLRLLGLTMRRVPVSQVVTRLLPWTIVGFTIMVISGAAFYAIPVRPSQHLFPGEGAPADPGGYQRLGVSRRHLAARRLVGSRRHASERRACGGGRVAGAVDGDHLRWTTHRVQLVRLRQAAAADHPMGERMQLRKLMRSARAVAILTILACLSSGCAGHLNDAVWRPVSDWSYLTAIGTVIHESSWLFAVIESFHLVGWRCSAAPSSSSTCACWDRHP